VSGLAQVRSPHSGERSGLAQAASRDVKTGNPAWPGSTHHGLMI